MSTIRFSNSNFVPFWRTEDESNLQTDTSRGYFDLQYESITNECSFPGVRQSDNLWVQFRTDYVNDADATNYFTGSLIDSLGNTTDITSDIVEIATLTDSRKQYEVSVNLSGLTGYFYLKFEFINFDKPVATYQSQWFEIATSFTNYLLVEWSNNSDLSTTDDGIIWGSANQKLWIPSRLSDYIPATEKAVYTTATGKQLVTETTDIKQKQWQIKPMPAYVAETLNLALGKHLFYINSERYSSEETIEGERLGDISLYPYEITLRLVETQDGIGYEDYTEDATLTGDVPVYPSTLRTTGVETRTTGLEDRSTNN